MARKKLKKGLLKEIFYLKAELKRLQEEVHKYRVLNKAVFAHAPVGITVRLGSGELISYNKAWKKIWNLTYHKIIENERLCKGKNVYERYPYLKEYAPKVQKIFDKGGEIFIPEIHVVDPITKFDKWLAQHYYAIMSADGKVEHVVTITQDITQQKKTQLALQESEEKFRTIVNNVNLGVYRSTPESPGYFLQVNPAFLKIFGYTSMKQVLKIPVEKFYKDPKERGQLLKDLYRNGEVRDREIEMKRKDGSTFWASIYAKAHFDENGNIQWIDGVIEDVTERKNMTATLQALSFTDELTGLYNRRGFMTLAEYQMRIAQRTKKSLLLLFIDMDNLKDINDAFGHPMGDQALIHTTMIIKRTFRESDIIARIGGDEFVVLTLEIKKTKAQELYERLQKRLEAFNESGHLPFKISLSAGWSYYNPSRPTTITNLLRSADKMMYLHKQRKKVKNTGEK
ncbi:MAG: sensor domain-containing diguanylate cyclase [candidate division WOR-3 bacterium]|nr:sensor domain-containing diguanylate cyclase [candidate division WOR-3 bacterium]